VRLKLEPGKGVYEYEVRFEPQVDSRGIRNRLLNEYRDKLGETKTFDGTTLYLPIQLQEEVSGNWNAYFDVGTILFCWY
jgi:aubergine-like protein